MSCFKKLVKRNFEPKLQKGMGVIYILLTISIIIAVVFFIAFIFAVKNGQYDDSYTPSVRMLFEDELVKEEPKKSTKNTID